MKFSEPFTDAFFLMQNITCVSYIFDYEFYNEIFPRYSRVLYVRSRVLCSKHE